MHLIMRSLAERYQVPITVGIFRELLSRVDVMYRGRFHSLTVSLPLSAHPAVTLEYLLALELPTL